MPYLPKETKKRFSITWSESDSEGETGNAIRAFTRRYVFENESNDEDMTEEELAATYRLLHTK